MALLLSTPLVGSLGWHITRPIIGCPKPDSGTRWQIKRARLYQSKVSATDNDTNQLFTERLHPRAGLWYKHTYTNKGIFLGQWISLKFSLFSPLSQVSMKTAGISECKHNHLFYFDFFGVFFIVFLVRCIANQLWKLIKTCRWIYFNALLREFFFHMSISQSKLIMSPNYL